MIGYPEAKEDTISKAMGYSSGCMILAAVVWGFSHEWAKKNFIPQIKVYGSIWAVIYVISQFIIHK